MSFAAEKLILQSCNSQVAAAMCTIFPQPVSSASALCRSDKAATVQQPGFQTVAATRQSSGTRSPISLWKWVNYTRAETKTEPVCKIMLSLYI